MSKRTYQMIKRNIPNSDKIVQFLHCGLCANEWKNDKSISTKMSPREYQNIQLGYTKLGFQVWCFRHEVNILHIDLQNFQFPANTTRKKRVNEKIE